METNQILIVFGIIFFVCGVSFIFFKRSNEKKLSAILSTEKFNAKELNGRVSSGSKQMAQITGTIECDSPLKGQLSNEDCVYYRTEVQREYEEHYTEKDSSGNDVSNTRRGSERVSHAENHTPFHVKDATGRVIVNPQGADIDLIKVVDKYERANLLNIAGGALSWGGFNFNISSSGLNNRRQNTLGYRFTEEILSPNQQVFVLGEAGSGGDGALISKPRKGNFIISTKSEEGLTESIQKTIKFLNIGTIVGIVLGAGLILAGLLAS